MGERPIVDLATEARAHEFADLGERSSAEVVRAVVAGHDAVLAAVLAAEQEIALLAEVAAARLAGGGRVIYAGAGAAGRVAAADASEWSPTFNVPAGTVVALLAGEHEVPGSAAEAAAEDDVDAGAADVTRAGAGSLDLCIGVSASGRTPYTLGAVRAAKAAGALTGAVVCQRGSALGEIAEVTVEVPVGPEVIAGSTRLKAATAQKLALGAFSTAVMVKRGRVLGNLMACMRVSNEKLRQRAVAVCCAATDCDERTGSLALEQSGGVLESALVMLLAGVDAAAAADALAATGGHLPAAVKRAGAPPAGTL